MVVPGMQPKKFGKIFQEIEFYEGIRLKYEMHRSEFWKKYELKIPRLARLVRSVCCGPPSTVGDESIFFHWKRHCASK
jgi:hypothetical protein